MSNTIFITANWTTGALSQQTISRQYDNNRYAVQFIGYPEGDGTEELDLYLLVWMSTAPGQKPGEITPIQLNSDQWYISNYFTQQVQVIKFQLCVLNEAGTYEAHSPIFSGRIGDSLEHDGTTQDIDVSTLFDAYREYLNELIIRAGAVVIDPTLSQSGQAADAKKTGDEITSLKEDLVQKATSEIPCAINPSGNKADLSLSGYSGKKVFISNKNLLPQFTAMTNNGVTCVKNADGSISLSGTANGVAVISITVNEMPNLGPGTYALSCGNSVAMGDNNTYINVEIDGTFANIYARFNAVYGKTVFTVPEGSAVTAIRIRVSSGVVVPEGFTCYPQIVEGSEFIDFIPHNGSILNPTSGTITGVEVYEGYTYICAQSGVSGTVTYDTSRIDDIERRVETLEQRSSKFEGKKIVCFGDSIVGNFPAPTDYPSMIAELTGATVYNAGFGGCCMSDNGQIRKDFTMCRLVDSIVAGDFSAQRNSGVSITYAGTSTDYVPERLTMLENIDWSDIDYITIAYGTNDWNSNYGLDNSENPTDTTTYIGAFRYSIEKLLTAYPHLKVMTITPLWRWWDTNTGMPSEIHSDYIDSNDYAKGTGYKLWQYGDALVAAAKFYHIPVFDLYWNCMMTKQNRFEYFDTTDGTHPKLKGRELMAELISAQLEAIY
jgi:lysophospholipase L1-like esterase